MSRGLSGQRGVRGHQRAVLVQQELTGRRRRPPPLTVTATCFHVFAASDTGAAAVCADRARARTRDRRLVRCGAGARRRRQVAAVVGRPAEREHRALLRRAGEPDVVGDRDVVESRQQAVRQPDRGRRPAVAARQRQAAPVVPDGGGVAVDDRRVPAVSGTVVDDRAGRSRRTGSGRRGCSRRRPGTGVRRGREPRASSGTTPANAAQAIPGVSRAQRGSRRRRRQREGERLGVGAGAQRLGRADGLLEADRQRVVADRPAVAVQRQRRGADRRERARAPRPGPAARARTRR